MLLLCARRKVLWSGTDLYQSMQMLDVGAGAGERGTSTRTPDCHPWQAGNEIRAVTCIERTTLQLSVKFRPKYRPNESLCGAKDSETS